MHDAERNWLPHAYITNPRIDHVPPHSSITNPRIDHVLTRPPAIGLVSNTIIIVIIIIIDVDVWRWQGIQRKR